MDENLEQVADEGVCVLDLIAEQIIRNDHAYGIAQRPGTCHPGFSIDWRHFTKYLTGADVADHALTGRIYLADFDKA